MSMMPKPNYHLRTTSDDEGNVIKLSVARNEHGLWTEIREITPAADKRPTMEQATAWAIQVAEQDRYDRARGFKPDSVRLVLADEPGALLTARQAQPPAAQTAQPTATEPAALV